MRAIILAAAWVFMMAPAVHAWALELGQPSLQYPVKATKEAITAAEAEMKKLRFESGMAFLNPPTPFRNLRFLAPGQSINDLVPLLRKLGFTVNIRLSDSLPANWGFTIHQPEDGSDTLQLSVNTRHTEFDRTKLTVPVKPPEAPATPKTTE